MELTPCQLTAKNQLYDYISSYFSNEYLTKNDVCWLQAPTGAGKTFIIARLIDAVCQKHPKTAVIFLTLSQGNLPEQASDKFDKYNMITPWEYIIAPSRNKTKAIDDPHDLIAHQKYTWIIGISSLRSNTIILDKGHWDPFVEDLGYQNQNLLLIWDEAHIGNQSQSKINEVIARTKKWFTKNNNQNKCFTLKTTATVPKKNKKEVDNIICINNSQAEDDHLIKSEQKLIFKKDATDENNNFEELIQETLKKFKVVKKKYQEAKVNINPAILIQVNGTQQKKYEEWDNNLLKIQRIIEKQNLTWAVYTNREKKLSPNLRKKKPTLRYLAANDCEVDVIIFIYALATGWDIPRACFLLQLKELKSQTLNIQTIGRIKRNPTPGLSNIKNTVFDQFFLYSNFKEDQKIFWQRKEDFKDFEISILEDSEWETKEDQEKFRKALDKLYSKEKQNILQYAERKIQQISYDNILLQLKIKKTSVKNTEINNLLELKKIWDEYAFSTNKKLKKHIEKEWIPQNNQKIYDWIWYCFFLEEINERIVQQIKDIWNAKYIINERRLFKLPPKVKLKEYILVDNSKTNKVDIKKEKEHFPYKKIGEDKTELQQIQLPLDSISEEYRWKAWSRELENQKKNKGLKKLFICKNFRQLNISYPIVGENNTSHKQHPDIIIRFNYQQKAYTLLVEIKSLTSGSEHHIDKERYRGTIESIKKSYPQLSKSMYEKGESGYFFILDKTEVTGKKNITCWFNGEIFYKGVQVCECFSKIMNINKQCLIQ